VSFQVKLVDIQKLPSGMERLFYDRSKALGELENNKDLTFRNSIVGPDRNINGIGLLNWFNEARGTSEVGLLRLYGQVLRL